MASAKTAVIEYLFNVRWNESEKRLTNPVVSLQELVDAMVVCNAKAGVIRQLSTRNPANFLKDVIRNKGAAKNWPKRIADLGFTGEQRPGSGNCFEFVKISEGQVESYLDLFRPSDKTARTKLQSLSMPRAAKTLGRSDEAWLIQTAVNLRVIEQHMATMSKLDVKDIVHLQMNVKLRKTEIDALYLATVLHNNVEIQALITCEAKRHDERILEAQIINQVNEAFDTKEAKVDFVVPIAIRSVKDVGIHVIEFQAVERSGLGEFHSLVFSQDAVYELQPHVKGI